MGQATWANLQPQETSSFVALYLMKKYTYSSLFYKENYHKKQKGINFILFFVHIFKKQCS
jgi:hypothetical protein